MVLASAQFDPIQLNLGKMVYVIHLHHFLKEVCDNFYISNLIYHLP